MSSEKNSPLTKMDRIRIVVEYSELSESEKAEYLKKNGIDQKTLQSYQQEAAVIIGGGQSQLQPQPKTRCEELIDELRERNEYARKDAARELGAMRHRATSAVEALIDRMLNDPIDFVRSWSSWALTRIDPRHPDVIEAFLQCITHDEEAVNARNWCAVGLSVSESDHVVERLIQILKNGQPFAQFSSIQVLSRMHVESPEYIEGLKAATGSDNESLQELARIELLKLQPSD